mmetsp:Transcript_56768/g.136362  ORF Transcript_56768/g.136362 Transcript_56768/m.136362 type:complete len:443 (+) Transcript_56768:304-1632(+)
MEHVGLARPDPEVELVGLHVDSHGHVVADLVLACFCRGDLEPNLLGPIGGVGRPPPLLYGLREDVLPIEPHPDEGLAPLVLLRAERETLVLARQHHALLAREREALERGRALGRIALRRGLEGQKAGRCLGGRRHRRGLPAQNGVELAVQHGVELEAHLGGEDLLQLCDQDVVQLGGRGVQHPLRHRDRVACLLRRLGGPGHGHALMHGGVLRRRHGGGFLREGACALPHALQLRHRLLLLLHGRRRHPAASAVRHGHRTVERLRLGGLRRRGPLLLEGGDPLLLGLARCDPAVAARTLGRELPPAGVVHHGDLSLLGLGSDVGHLQVHLRSLHGRVLQYVRPLGGGRRRLQRRVLEAPQARLELGGVRLRTRRFVLVVLQLRLRDGGVALPEGRGHLQLGLLGLRLSLARLPPRVLSEPLRARGGRSAERVHLLRLRLRLA